MFTIASGDFGYSTPGARCCLNRMRNFLSLAKGQVNFSYCIHNSLDGMARGRVNRRDVKVLRRSLSEAISEDPE